MFLIVFEFFQDGGRLTIDQGCINLVDVDGGKDVIDLGLHHGPFWVLERILLIHHLKIKYS